MTAAPRPHAKARELFDQMLEQPATERDAFVQRACGHDAELRAELASLLRLHEAGERTLCDPTPPVAERAGDRIGHYKLLQPIGEGGFGTVWMAEQEQPVNRRVALKVLKAGMDTAQVVARFEAERQALARMDHPNIAQVYDGGSTARGRPFFVMELVRGVPITQYCDEASLSPRERLELFVAVCQAVQHAHHKGVIHRDIKPGNVLVTLHDGKPVPKVIDFGIAKATQGRLTERTMFTEFRQLLGTPEYMAPEQAELSGLDIDTRADVYSLGVLLYELLTGARPFDFRDLLAAGYGEMLRTIREVEPPKPSTRVSTLGERLPGIAKHRRMHPRALGPLMRGDLDWIVMRTLEKERNRRYATPMALADDVQRYLRSEPVEAGPPSRLYRLRKYVHRHRFGVGAAAAIAVSLLAGAVAAGAGWMRASDEAHTARIAAARAQRVVALLDQMLGSADPHALKGPDYSVRRLLDDFEREFTGQLADEPEVEAGLRATLSGSYAGLGLAAPARAQAARAKELRLRLYGERSAEHADSLLLDGAWMHIDGRYDEAATACEQAVAILRPLDASHMPKLVEALITLGDLEYHRRRGEQADAAIAEAIEWARRLGDESAVTNAMERAAAIHQQRGNLDAAETVLRQLLERRQQYEAGASLAFAGTWGGLATVLGQRGRYDEAGRCAEEAVRIALEAAGDMHPSVAWHRITLGSVLMARGEFDLAVSLLEGAVATQRAALGDASPALATGLRTLARAETYRGRLAAAEGHASEALQIDSRLTPGLGTAVADDHLVLATALTYASNFAEATRHAQLALTLRRRLLGDEHPDVAQARCELAQALNTSGRLDEAESELRQALASLAACPQEQAKQALAQNGLASVLLEKGQAAEAESLAQASLATTLAMHGEKHPRVAELRLLLAQAQAALAPASAEARATVETLLGHAVDAADDDGPVGARKLALLGRSQLQRGDLGNAEQTLRAALERQTRLLPSGHLDIATTTNDLGLVLEAQGKLAPAEEALQASLQAYRAQLGESHDWIASTLASLGKVRLGMGDHAAAGQFYGEALAMRERLPGEQGPLIARCLHGVGDAKRLAGEFAEAATFLRRALELRRAKLTLPHAEVANNLNTLGFVLTQQNELDEAQHCYRSALEMQQQLGADWSTLWRAILNLGVVLERNGDAAIAEEMYREQLEVVRGPGHDRIDLANVQAQLGNCLLIQDRAAEAEAPLAECLAIRSELMPNDWRRHVAASQLGAALLATGKHAEAEPLLLEAAGKMRPPPNQIDRRFTAIERLVALYEATGRPEQAATWRQKLPADRRR